MLSAVAKPVARLWCVPIAILVVAACSDPATTSEAADIIADSAAADAEIPGDSEGQDAVSATDGTDLPDAATPQGCPGKPGCPCESPAQCQDDDPCTAPNACVNGACGFPAPMNCDDGNICTNDVCLPAGGCTSTVDDGLPCSDSNVCTLDDACEAGACIGGKPRNCLDGNVCTDDLCIGGVGCTFAHNKIQCREGNACIKPAICSFGSCPASALIPCNDKNVCTYDTCTPDAGCETLPLPAPATDCDGEVRWGRCFVAFKEKKTWFGARERCRKWGGELVSVRDKYDNDFIAKYAEKACGKQGAWIGLTDVAREWTWRWSDGTPYGFRGWNKGEPNNAGNEDFTEMVPGGGWNDVGVKAERGCLVCARPMQSPCNDGDGCTAGDFCALAQAGTETNAAPMAMCATGTNAVDCDDNSPCTLDSCNKKTGCTHKPVADKKPCGDGTCTKGVCYWPEKSVFSSCKEALNKLKDPPNGVYTLLGVDKDGKALKYQTWCEMAGEHGGGWTLVLQSDGKSATFAWGNKLWTDKNVHNAAKAPWLNIDVKLASYWNVPGMQTLLMMKRGAAVRSAILPMALVDKNGKESERSLHAVIGPGKHVKTALDYKQWKQLIPNSSLQNNCHVQGFNAMVKGAGRARLGIIGNNENNCDTPDSWLGVGGHEKMCNNKEAKSTGNVACYSADNGTRRWAAFAWVLVR